MTPGRVSVGMSLVIVGVLFVSAAGAAAAPVSDRPFRASPLQDYDVYVPTTYTDEEIYPLFVAVHGGVPGSPGDFEFWQSYAEREGFLLISPRINGAALLEDSTYEALIGMINDASQRYSVDRDRIILSGCSWGSYCVYRFVKKYPLIAHAVAIFNTSQSQANIFEPPAESTGVRWYLASRRRDQQPDLANRLERAGYQVSVQRKGSWDNPVTEKSAAEVMDMLREMRIQGVQQGMQR